MKKLLPYFLIFCTTLAHADRLQYFYGVGVASPTSKLLTVPSGQSIFILNTNTGLGDALTISSYLDIDLTAKTIGVNAASLPVSTAVQTALNLKQDHSPYLDEVVALGGQTNKAVHTDGTGQIVADTQSDFLTWLNGVSQSRTLSAGSGLTGGGDLSANRTISLSAASIASLSLADTSVQPATLSGYATTAALTAGLAAKFNTPVGTTAQYLRGDGTLATFPTNNTAFTNGAGYLTAEVDGNTTNEIELPSQTGNNGKLLTTNGASPSWATLTPRSFNKPTRALNTVFQISATQDANVSYTVDIACTLSLAVGQSGTVVLEYADNVGMTTNVVTVQSTVNGNTGTLAVGFSLTQTTSGSLTGTIPAGKYVRLRTVNNTGTPVFTIRDSQEVLLQQLSMLLSGLKHFT